MLLATHFFCKYGPREKFVAWHQDVTYWGLEPPDAVTAWYAIDDSDIGNGCMQVIPGSHQRGIQEHGTSEQEGNLLSINQEVPVTEAEAETAVDLVLKAGEMSIHHGQIIHGSLPNHSTRRRCGLTIRYIPPSVKQAEDNSLKRPWKPILLRGEDPAPKISPLSLTRSHTNVADFFKYTEKHVNAQIHLTEPQGKIKNIYDAIIIGAGGMGSADRVSPR